MHNMYIDMFKSLKNELGHFSQNFEQLGVI